MKKKCNFAIILPARVAGNRKIYTDALRNADIEVRPIVAGNFTRQRALQFLDYSISGALEHADYIHENGFFVGNHSTEMQENINLLIDVLKTV